MNPIEQHSDEIPIDEQAAFRKLVAGSHFNDAVDVNHQNALRCEVLRTFDRSPVTASVVTSVITTPPQVGHALCFGVVVAACLFLVVAVSFIDLGDPHDGGISGDTFNGWVQADQMIDAELVRAIEEVNSLADDVPRKLFFSALATCQQEHEARQHGADDTRMHWYNESSLLPPGESSKG